MPSGMVRVGEVDGQIGVPFKLLVTLHLGAVVERQAAYAMFGEWRK